MGRIKFPLPSRPQARGSLADKGRSTQHLLAFSPPATLTSGVDVRAPFRILALHLARHLPPLGGI